MQIESSGIEPSADRIQWDRTQLSNGVDTTSSWILTCVTGVFVDVCTNLTVLICDCMFGVVADPCDSSSQLCGAPPPWLSLGSDWWIGVSTETQPRIPL